MNATELARAIAELASDRKAADISLLDLRGLASFTDYFVICSGRSDRQVRAIHDAVQQGMKAQHAVTPTRVEGLTRCDWVLMDYGDVIVQIFTPELRDFYRLEQLWGEAPVEHFEAESAAA